MKFEEKGYSLPYLEGQKSDFWKMQLNISALLVDSWDRCSHKGTGSLLSYPLRNTSVLLSREGCVCMILIFQKVRFHRCFQLHVSLRNWVPVQLRKLQSCWLL